MKPDGNREVRQVVKGVELRQAPEGSKSPGTVVGYAAVFGVYSADLGMFREKIAPGAFSKALARSDARALQDHDPSRLLGRQSAGTLRLREDATGLLAEYDLPDTTDGRNVAELIRRGDIQGQSFCFTTALDAWEFGSETSLRTLIEIGELFDVGPVTYPAYEETSVAMRAFNTAREAHDRSKATEANPSHALESERDRDRARLVEVS
jgi:hypothetical protein